MNKEEAKKVMSSNWTYFSSQEDALNAILDKDQTEIDTINALRSRVKTYNDNLISDIDSASPSEFTRMVSTFKPYQDNG